MAVRKDHRPWTAEETATATELRANGASWRTTARALGRHPSTVKRAMNQAAWEANRRHQRDADRRRRINAESRRLVISPPGESVEARQRRQELLLAGVMALEEAAALRRARTWLALQQQRAAA